MQPVVIYITYSLCSALDSQCHRPLRDARSRAECSSGCLKPVLHRDASSTTPSIAVVLVAIQPGADINKRPLSVDEILHPPSSPSTAFPTFFLHLTLFIHIKLAIWPLFNYFTRDEPVNA